ncbi:hypothetical protein KI387_035551, partial [Taxus chinensis]
MDLTLDKYKKCSKRTNTNINSQQEVQNLKVEIADLKQKYEMLETRKRHLLGEDLTSFTMEDINNLEIQVDRGLTRIRARKELCLLEAIKQCEVKEQILIEENTLLRKK